MPEDIFRWVVTAGVLIIAVSAVGQVFAFLGILKGLKATESKVNTLVAEAGPVVEKARQLIDQSVPKITAITNDAVQVTQMAKSQMLLIQDVVQDITSRTKAHVARLDKTVDSAIEDVDSARTAVRSAVLRPVREVDGLLTGIRAGMASYFGSQRESVDQATQDEEMFI